MKKKVLPLVIVLVFIVSVVLFAQNAFEIDGTGQIVFRGPIRIVGNQRIEVVNVTNENQVLNHYDLLPVGTILMFDGTNWRDSDQSNPTMRGWWACTAANAGDNTIPGGVPDLQNSFVMGTHPGYLNNNPTVADPDRYGGSNNQVLANSNIPRHNHGVTVSSADLAHTHGIHDIFGFTSMQSYSNGILLRNPSTYMDESRRNIPTEENTNWPNYNLLDFGNTNLTTANVGPFPISDPAGVESMQGREITYVYDWQSYQNDSGYEDWRPLSRTITEKIPYDGNMVALQYRNNTLGSSLNTDINSTSTNWGGNAQGNTTSFENRPEFYTVIYIKKCE